MSNNQKRRLKSPKEVVKAARKDIGNTNYSVLFNDGQDNCEGKARKYKTGVAESTQVDNLKDVAATVVATGLATVAFGPLGGAAVAIANASEKSKKFK